MEVSVPGKTFDSCQPGTVHFKTTTDVKIIIIIYPFEYELKRIL